MRHTFVVLPPAKSNALAGVMQDLARQLAGMVAK